MNAEAGRLLRALRHRTRCDAAARQLQHRHPADGGASPAPCRLQGAAGDHGRADLIARRARGGDALRGDPQLEGRRRLGDFRQPQTRRALRRLRPRHDHARRAHGVAARHAEHQPSCNSSRRCWAARSRSRGRARPASRRAARRLGRARRCSVPRTSQRGSRVRDAGVDGAPGRDRGAGRAARLGPHRNGPRDLRRRPADRAAR